MKAEYVVLDNKDYIIMEKLLINNIKYYILASEEQKDVCIRKEITEENEKYLVGLDNEEEFNLVMEKYLNKTSQKPVTYLPIGTIVTLHNCSFDVLVMGYSMKNKDGDVYDYCGCRSPIGLMNNKDLLCFDRENISGIKKMGYIDDEAKVFLDKIEATYYN